ncbi:MAG TPA: S41 family peptidase [Vicinamibacterales bacterium]|nr:S41 family peptidase [Vicinamibacterales bacterium]
MGHRYGVFSVAAFAVLVSALLGGLLGRQALATDSRQQDYRTFTEALSAVEANYIDKVDSSRLVYGAVEGMLQTLDPHSSFMDPDLYRRMRERQEGRYYGLGITILTVNGDITVVSLFEGSPAYRKGIRRGDIIARIEGEDAKGWTSDDAVKRLRGPKGTTVKVSLKRPGYDQLIEVEVPRDEIHIPSIPAYFMVDRQTGYVRLQDFAENTDRDLDAALKDLARQGMKRLLLDLRANPGGPLDQAIRVSNNFLPRGSLIVYTRGRVQNSDKDYRATEQGDYPSMPMVVLVNRNSASASEIVSGALQDHDRALIVGETTFGKALVQSVYTISEQAGLALTTARYYTPSDRMIQRPWDGTFDEYLNYTLQQQNPDRERKPSDLRHTQGGRKVYSGGGIEPDRRLDGPIEGFNPSPFGRLVYNRQLFASFAEHFVAEGDNRIAPSAGQRRVSKDFVVDDAMLQEFKEFIRGQKVTVAEEAFAKDEAFMRAMIRYDIDLALFGVSEARRNLVTTDPQVQFALDLFPEAEQLAQLRQGRAASKGGQ